MDNLIQHWLTSVARAADLPGAEDLTVDSQTDSGPAWKLAAMTSGISERELAGVVARHFRLDVANLDDMDPQAHNLIPGPLARRLQVIPLWYSDRNLTVATSDPVSLEVEKELGRISDRNVIYRVAPPSDIGEALERVYEEEDEDVHRLPPLDAKESGAARILVVEDDADTRLLLRSALESSDHEVVEAADGEAAIEALEEVGGFHLVSLDLKLPGLSGLEVLERIRRMPRWRRVPVIVATGYDDPEVEILLFETGADDFIVKPVDPRRFILRVQAVLRRLGGFEATED